MKKIKLGIIGGGKDSLIGVLHRIASKMYDQYELVGGVFNPNFDENIGFAKEIGIPTNRVYKDFDTLVAEESKLAASERMEVISVLTPNFLHYEMAKKLILNKFHVICEKPMTTSLQEAIDLSETLDKNPVIFALTHTYTGYNMARELREIVKRGMLGEIQKIDVKYYQGWINPIIHDVSKRSTTWRLDSTKAGISCCVGDIGTHAFNLIEYATGLSPNRVLADLNYLYSDNKMDIDATVLLRFSNQCKGVLRVSQIATGEENNLSISIYGKKAGVKWEQEIPTRLFLLEENKPLQVYKSGNTYNSKLSLDCTKIPPGHPEGVFDAMGNIYNGVAKAIRKQSYDSGEFPTLKHGVRGMEFIEKVVQSHKEGNIWVEMEY